VGRKAAQMKELLKYAGSLAVGVVGTILFPKVFKKRAKREKKADEKTE